MAGQANAVLPVHEELADGFYLSAVYASPKDRRHQTDPLPVRVIEYTVTTGAQVSGFRLHVMIPDVARHWAVKIRMFVARARRLNDFAELEALPPHAARFLDTAVASGLNILILGATQAGKPANSQRTFMSKRSSRWTDRLGLKANQGGFTHEIAEPISR